MFKKFLFVFVLAVVGNSIPAFADLYQDLQRCRAICSPECQNLSFNTQLLLNQLNNECNFTTQPIMPARHTIKFYRSDSCSGSYLGAVNAHTVCDSFAKGITENAWGLRIDDGNCQNIPDMPLATACRAFQGYTPESVLFYKSDSCSDLVMGAVNPFTDCQAAGAGMPVTVWAIRVKGECINITDTPFAPACERYKNGHDEKMEE